MAGTAYETPVTPGGDNPPYLVFDGLGASLELRRDWLRAVITRVLTRKYKGVCGPEYVDMVVRSVRDGPVRLREPRYQDAARTARLRVARRGLGAIALVVTDQHEIHHVRERGSGAGLGFNVNYPLAEHADPERYRAALRAALAKVRAFAPVYLVVCLGLDTAKGDPTGSWSNRGVDFERMGEAIGAVRLPTLVVQEGGYENRSIGANAARFFEGLARGLGLG